jgi:hypothetical protein
VLAIVSAIKFSNVCKSVSIEEKSCENTAGEKSNQQENKRAKAIGFFMQGVHSLKASRQAGAFYSVIKAAVLSTILPKKRYVLIPKTLR